jgi:hypothetical protein
MPHFYFLFIFFSFLLIYRNMYTYYYSVLVQYMQVAVYFYTLFCPFTTLLFCAENSLSSISLFPRKIACKSRAQQISTWEVRGCIVVFISISIS